MFYLEQLDFKTLFELPLLMDNNTSLAECLHSGYLVVETWHQSLQGTHMFLFSTIVECSVGEQPYLSLILTTTLCLVSFESDRRVYSMGIRTTGDL